MKNTKLKNFINMNIGCLLLSAGVYFFKIPNGFVTGGVSGIATLLGKLSLITPGAWEIKFNEKNAAAKKLWTQVTSAYHPNVYHLNEVETVLEFVC